MYKVENILVPIDYSEVSRAAVSMAIQVADRHDATIYLLHVQKDLDRQLKQRIVTAPNENVLSDVIDADEKQLLELLNLEYTRCNKAGHELKRAPVHLIVSGGEWLDVALRIIEDEEIDVVMSGTHGPQGIKGFLLGSVTEQLVARSTCSVFVVKPQGYPYLRD